MSTPTMEYRRLGSSGLRVSVLSFGSWVTFQKQVAEDDSFALMKAAYEAGINFFDNAEGYEAGGAETLMGASIQRGIREKVWDRSDLVVSTKIFFGTRKGPNQTGLSRKHIVEGVQASLKRLQLEYVDLVFCHRPDPFTSIEETVRAMHHVVERGWALYWGTSEWSAFEIMDAVRTADRLGLHRPVMDQPEYNMFQRARVEVEYAPLYRDIGLGTTIWSPLASGVLTGKYSGQNVPEGSRLSLDTYAWLKDIKFKQNAWQIDKTDELKPVAERLGCTLAQLAIAWCVSNTNVSSVILGATSVKQLQENIAALAVVPKLTPEVIAEIDKILDNKPQVDRIGQQTRRVRSLV